MSIQCHSVLKNITDELTNLSATDSDYCVRRNQQTLFIFGFLVKLVKLFVVFLLYWCYRKVKKMIYKFR